MPLNAALSLVDTDTLELGEKPLTLSELCGRLGVKTSSVRKRMREGRTILEAVYDTLNSQLRDRVKIDGTALAEARKRAGLSGASSRSLLISRGSLGLPSIRFILWKMEGGESAKMN